VPTRRLDVAKVATPPESVPVPSSVLPLKKATEPVGVLVEDETVAVKVTGLAMTVVLADEVSVIVGVAFVTVNDTVALAEP
jgi:hypothetical protein